MKKRERATKPAAKAAAGEAAEEVAWEAPPSGTQGETLRVGKPKTITDTTYHWRLLMPPAVMASRLHEQVTRSDEAAARAGQLQDRRLSVLRILLHRLVVDLESYAALTPSGDITIRTVSDPANDLALAK